MMLSVCACHSDNLLNQNNKYLILSVSVSELTAVYRENFAPFLTILLSDLRANLTLG